MTDTTPAEREQEAVALAKSLGLNGRFEDGIEIQVVGLNASYTMADHRGIPAQWETFGPSIGQIPGQAGHLAYGVSWNFKADSFDYLAGVELAPGAATPDGLTRVTLPAGRYAVFTHTGHVSQFPQTLGTIHGKWLPASKLKSAKAPWYERYSKEFDAQTGGGSFEIWIPIQHESS